MKKRYEELTELEENIFLEELSRMYIFGAVCMSVAADNANEEAKGWPLISLGGGVEVPLCDALDFLRKRSENALLSEIGMIPFGVVMSGTHGDVDSLAIHEAMHDAFCLGVAAVTLMEMDFKGADELIDKINEEKGNDES